jgi:hypothetical protein
VPRISSHHEPNRHIFVIVASVTFSQLGSVYFCFGQSGWIFLFSYINMELHKISATHVSKAHDNDANLSVTQALLGVKRV